MNILIAGGTGFVGAHLTDFLISKGNNIYILTRSPHRYDNTNGIVHVDYDTGFKHLPVIHAVINLAGDSLFGYWTKKKKTAILTSRIETTKTLVQWMKLAKIKPDVFINGSAVGFYGTSDDTIFTEKTITPGKDFLADVTSQWENEAKQAEQLGVRTIYARFGVILGNQGALKMMSLPVKLFAGGKIGSGNQWLSWIHIQDVVHLLYFSLKNERMEGPVNFTSPSPKRNKDFTKTLAKVLKRPYWLPTPALFMRLIVGEMSLLVTKGQYVLPQKAIDENYQFLYAQIDDALRNIQSTYHKQKLE